MAQKKEFPAVTKIKLILLLGPLAASSAVISASANETNFFQRGSHTEVVVETWGPNRTDVAQMGSNGRVRFKVRGGGIETHAFTGISEPGSPSCDVNIRGDDTLNIIVAPCR
jgi:hypothetical protein